MAFALKVNFTEENVGKCPPKTMYPTLYENKVKVKKKEEP